MSALDIVYSKSDEYTFISEYIDVLYSYCMYLWFFAKLMTSLQFNIYAINIWATSICNY